MMDHKLVIPILVFFTLLATTAYSTTAYNLDFSESHTVSMELVEGDSLTYAHENEYHIIFLSDVSKSSIVLEINQEPVVLMLNKEVAVDVESDGVFELGLVLENTKDNTASLRFTQIHTTEPHKDTEVGIVTVNVTQREGWATGFLTLPNTEPPAFLLVIAVVIGLFLLAKYKFFTS